jgi:hypothetical protein
MFIEMLSNIKGPNINGWQDRHLEALNYPLKQEKPIVLMLCAWLNYAEDYYKRYESHIGLDGFLGDGWEQIGDGIRTLLNGECGRLDCGTLDCIILDAMQKAGVDVEQK